MDDENDVTNENLFVPSPRMGSALAVKNNVLFLFGGVFESDDKQWTMSDFYSIDLHKMDEWKILIKDDERGKVRIILHIVM